MYHLDEICMLQMPVTRNVIYKTNFDSIHTIMKIQKKFSYDVRQKDPPNKIT